MAAVHLRLLTDIAWDVDDDDDDHNNWQPDFIAAGTLTGQVALWDISENMSALTRKQRANNIAVGYVGT